MMNEFVWYCNESGHQILPDHVEPPWVLERGGTAYVCSADENKALQAYFDESGGSDAAWIRPVQPSPRAKKTWRRYAPLRDNPALFRTFVDVEYKQESIVKFANRFGLLTDPQKGEPLGTWAAAISDMRSTVECWQEARQVDALPLPGNHDIDIRLKTSEGGTGKSAFLADAKCLQGSFGAATGVSPATDIDVLAASSHQPDRRVFVGFNSSDRHDALKLLASRINENISHVRSVLVILDGLDEISLRPMPTTLLEAMWLQFGQAVASNRSLRKCRHCGTWFDLSPKAARIDKVFCSEACKARAYRRRLSALVKKKGEPWVLKIDTEGE
jgi:hypothetical protein